VLSWLLLAVLGMIWAAFLLPSWRRSPTSTVEEFEERLNVLAEANKVTAGRWVLMPRQGRRFLGPEDRQRARLRRRRRAVFMTMLEVMALTTIMGLFPPLRAMLYVTVFLSILLVAYIALLLKIRADERSGVRPRRAPVAATGRSIYKAGNGYGRPYGSDDVYANGNGAGVGAEPYDQQFLREGGVQIIDEDVHVVVRRSDEFDVQALRASGGRSSG
jgi:Flp pilus assembly protein TadB